MLIRKGVKFRLETDRFLGAIFLKFTGCARFVWNTTLSIQKKRILRDIIDAFDKG